MEIVLKRGVALQRKSPCLVVGVCEGAFAAPRLKEIDAALDGAIGQAQRDKEFSGKAGELLLLHAGKRLAAQRVLLVGLGKERDYHAERVHSAVAAAVTLLQGKRIASLCLDLASLTRKGVDLEAAATAAAEAIGLSAYRYDEFRGESGKELPPLLTEALLLSETAKGLDAATAAVVAAGIVCDGVNLARDLVNAPGNAKSPEAFALRCRDEAKQVGMACTILDREMMAQEGMGALLGVAQGSVREPQMIILEYQGGGAEPPLALIGKGVMFDAGGISLKPAEKMEEMKMDMAGAAAVLATLLVAARLGLKQNLVGLIPAVENLPSGTAIRPGDILTSLSGKTIEVINTDAEGRLILADALTYAKRYQPRAMIDLATLTGACVVALGSHASAVLGNNEALVKQLLSAGTKCGERLWQLPLWDDYAKQLKSDVADLKNTGGRAGGTITGAAFLQAFVKDCPWAHLDIAGTAWEEKGRPGMPKGGTGVGVRLLIEYLRKSIKA